MILLHCSSHYHYMYLGEHDLLLYKDVNTISTTTKCGWMGGLLSWWVVEFGGAWEGRCPDGRAVSLGPGRQRRALHGDNDLCNQRRGSVISSTLVSPTCPHLTPRSAPRGALMRRSEVWG